MDVITQLVNEQAEKAVIGSMLLNNETIPSVRRVLGVDDFHGHNYQRIAHWVFELHEQGKPVDAVTVGQFLGRELKDSWKATTVISLILEAVPHSANAVYYAEIVKDLSNRRQVYWLCRKLARKLPDTSFTVGSMLERFQELTNDFAKGTPSVTSQPQGKRNNPHREGHEQSRD